MDSKRRVALVVSILARETSVGKAARTHGLPVAEVGLVFFFGAEKG